MNEIYRPLTVYDYFLFPLYLFLIFIIFRKIKSKYKQYPHLQKYLQLGFIFKVLMVIVFTFLTNFLLRGDSVDLYFREGKNFANIISNNPSQVKLLVTEAGTETDDLATDEEKGYLSKETNYMVVRVSIILCFLTFSKYLLVNLLMGFIAFYGSWRLFLFFREIIPGNDKLLAIACLGVPTVIFWTSGIGKDSICMASIGFFTKAFFDLVHRRRVLLNTIICLVSIFLIYNIKLYIIISYLPFYLFFILMYSIGKTKNPLTRILLKVSIPVIFALTVIIVYANSNELLKKFSSEALLESVTKARSAFIAYSAVNEGSYFTLAKDFDGTIGGLIKAAPRAVEATFFRPYIWESRNMVMLFSSLENLIILFFTIKIFLSPRKILRFFKRIFSSSLVIYCIGYALLFAVFVGITSLNFGSLVRYKLPCIPFFIVGLILLNKKSPQKPKAIA